MYFTPFNNKNNVHFMCSLLLQVDIAGWSDIDEHLNIQTMFLDEDFSEEDDAFIEKEEELPQTDSGKKSTVSM